MPPGRRRRGGLLLFLLSALLPAIATAASAIAEEPTSSCPSSSSTSTSSTSTRADGVDLSSSFQRAMRAYPWRALEAAVNASDAQAVDALAEQMIEVLAPFLVLPPVEEAGHKDGGGGGGGGLHAKQEEPPARSSLFSAVLNLLPLSWRQEQEQAAAATAWCEALPAGCPPALPSPKALDCAAYPDAGFTGRKRAAPARVAHAIQFAFDADVLEILLWEIGDLVDVFFLLESTRTHNRGACMGQDG